MGALTTESAGRVRQKAYEAVYGGIKTGAVTSPFHFYALKALFLHLAANKGNIDLQYLPYGDGDVTTTDTGFQPITSGACTLYAWFGRSRRASGTTAAFMEITDASDDFDTSTTTITTQLINATKQSFFIAWPDGFPIATALNVGSTTAVGGATISTAGQACDGFVIVGA
jgi:hypothetical protein